MYSKRCLIEGCMALPSSKAAPYRDKQQGAAI